jgi:class 3 adenylate cyclase
MNHSVTNINKIAIAVREKCGHSCGRGGDMQIEAMGERIREARGRLGLTQQNVADALQVSAQAVSKWERGENAPDTAALPHLAQLLGVSTDRLLGTTAPDGPTIEATVMFTDLKGFVKRVRDLSASDMATLLNAHFLEVTEVVLRYDAIPVKYLGDSFLCFFAGLEHRERALRAALHAIKLVSDPVSIGISSGEVYAGRVGHPLHATFDIIGETVNHAALAERLCGRTEFPIVATGPTVRPAESLVETSPVTVESMGPLATVECFGVTGLKK